MDELPFACGPPTKDIASSHSAKGAEPSLSTLLRAGFARPPCLQDAGKLLPYHFNLTCERTLHRRCVSVALSLWSPTPDVIRCSCSMEPGLSSRQNMSRNRPACSENILYHKYGDNRSAVLSGDKYPKITLGGSPILCICYPFKTARHPRGNAASLVLSVGYLCAPSLERPSKHPRS